MDKNIKLNKLESSTNLLDNEDTLKSLLKSNQKTNMCGMNKITMETGVENKLNQSFINYKTNFFKFRHCFLFSDNNKFKGNKGISKVNSILCNYKYFQFGLGYNIFSRSNESVSFINLEPTLKYSSNNIHFTNKLTLSNKLIENKTSIEYDNLCLSLVSNTNNKKIQLYVNNSDVIDPIVKNYHSFSLESFQTHNVIKANIQLSDNVKLKSTIDQNSLTVGLRRVVLNNDNIFLNITTGVNLFSSDIGNNSLNLFNHILTCIDKKEILGFKYTLGIKFSKLSYIYFTFFNGSLDKSFEIGLQSPYIILSIPVSIDKNIQEYFNNQKNRTSQERIVSIGKDLIIHVIAEYFICSALKYISNYIYTSKKELVKEQKLKIIQDSHTKFEKIAPIMTNCVTQSTKKKIKINVGIVGTKRKLNRYYNDMIFDSNYSNSLLDSNQRKSLCSKHHNEICDITLTLEYLYYLGEETNNFKFDYNQLSSFSIGYYNPIYTSEDIPYILINYQFESNTFLILRELSPKLVISIPLEYNIKINN